MHLIYLDLLTTVLFFGFIGYLERFGMIGKNKVSPILIQKVNQLIYHNLWLYVLPYFYSITLMSDLENFFGLTYYANQIWYFLLILLVQMVVFMKIQPVGTLVYFLKLRDIWQKIFSKNSQDDKHEVATGLDVDFTNINVKKAIRLPEVQFMINAFGLPLLFMLTNAYVFTKIIFLFI